MTRIFSCVVALLFITVSATAQTLTDQINAVDAAQQQNAAVQQQRAAEEQAVVDAKQAELRRAIQQQNAAAATKQKQKAEAAEADKKRDQSYEDQLRDLEVQRQALELQAGKNYVNRQNDYIDQELQKNAAETDVIKSEAEANRNISSGAKTYLENSADQKPNGLKY